MEPATPPQVEPRSDSVPNIEARAEKLDLLRDLLQELDRGNFAAVEAGLSQLVLPLDASQVAVTPSPRPENLDEPSVSSIPLPPKPVGDTDSIKLLFQDHDILPSGKGSVPSALQRRYPKIGEDIFGFRIRRKLGSGAFATVFLAEEKELPRPVVLKISPIEGTEPHTLARLQHTHIVPIYTMLEDPKARLRVVCMPFFGGDTLSKLLEEIYRDERVPDKGQEWVDALRRVAKKHEEEDGRNWFAGERETPSLPLRQFAKFDYFQTVAWLIARLAEGLDFAHGRGFVHRDIKPSNILIGADGQPMMLDFNLAEHRAPESLTPQAPFGGTVRYMAPEHLKAMGTRAPIDIDRVDHRSDIYSLGMVFLEALVGHREFEKTASRTLHPEVIQAMGVERAEVVLSARAIRKEVPWSLESIVRKCLDPEPANRYQSAGELAEDLDAFLIDRPLVHAPELSVRERWQKWQRRHPKLNAAGQAFSAASLLLVVLGGILSATLGSLHDTQGSLAQAQARERFDRFQKSARRAQVLLHSKTDLPGLDLQAQGWMLSKQALDEYDAIDKAPKEHPDWQRLDAVQRGQLGEQMHELLAAYAWGATRGGADWSRALELLDRAESWAPATRALWEDRAYFQEKLGQKEAAATARAEAERRSPSTARDYFLLATAYLNQEGPNGRALTMLDKALALDPQHYWSLVQRGSCQLERGDTVRAVADFSECVGLWPDFPLGYFHRGYAWARSGQMPLALQDYTFALDRDPDFVLALLNRGLGRLETKDLAGARADFDKALLLGQNTAAVHLGRGVALEGQGLHQEADAAFAEAWKLEAGLDSVERRNLRQAYAFAVYDRLPFEARKAFDYILDRAPRDPQALYGRGMLAARDNHLEEAIDFFSQVVAIAPNLTEARRYRAILSARQKRFEQAIQDIDWLLQRNPGSGAVHYAAACVAVRAAERLPAAQVGPFLDRAFDYLTKAFHLHYGREIARDDPDLAFVRDHPRLAKILEHAK